MAKSICKTDINGDKHWYLNGNLHRKDGPAIERADGNKFWYLNDKLHREDGPACEWSDGTKHWYLNGIWVKCTTQKEFLQLLKLKGFW